MLHGHHADDHIESMVSPCLELGETSTFSRICFSDTYGFSSVQPDNLRKLFEVRQLFSRVDSRQVVDHQKTVNVCWADVLISRIGDVIPMLVAVFNTGCRTPGTYTGVLEGYRRGTSLRATLQLPGSVPLNLFYNCGFRRLFKSRKMDISPFNTLI